MTQQLLNSDEENFSLDSIIGSQIDKLINENEQALDIITFSESPHYLDQPLHGVEKFILKVFYGIPLTSDEKYILVRFFPDDEEGTYMSETEYAEFLMQQKRINILDLDYKAAKYLLLVCGRRGGKTFIASIISCYEAYLLISKGNPQKHYALPRGQEIKIITVATNSDQAKIAATMIQKQIKNAPWLSKYVHSSSQQVIRLKTKHELENNLEPSIIVEAMSCTASGIRGHTVIVAILDELAHFTDNSGNRAGDSVWYGLVPSVGTFGSDGKILALSNPYTKSGIFYKLYTKAMGSPYEPPVQNIRAFQLPSWEMNDTLDFEFFHGEYTLNPESFDYEYGAEFATTITGFFKFPEKIDECVDNMWMEPIRPKGNYTHYIAMDPASVDHGYALCMVHIEEKVIEDRKIKIVVVDRWKRWLAEDDEFAATGLNIIDPAIVDEYILDLSRNFRIARVQYDQYESASSVNKLVKAGVKAERVPKTASINMEVYKNLRNLIYNNEIIIPNLEDGLGELYHLQEKRISKNKFRVCAPATGDVVTDDMADALAVASYMAITSEVSIGSGAKIAGMNTATRSMGGTSSTMSNTRLQAIKQKRLIQRLRSGSANRRVW